VTGIDITLPFVEAGRKLNALVGMEPQVTIDHGDAMSLPYESGTFDGACTQHVTMNIPDRARFFREAFRVLKSGAFFALSEHGLGPAGNPHHPVPWSADGSGAYLARPEKTVDALRAQGFVDIDVEYTGPKYIAAYAAVIAKAEQGLLPPLGTHLLLGDTALEKTRNAKRNIEEGRTEPIQVTCRKRD
jgi:SAM-dependent methyltransferase